MAAAEGVEELTSKGHEGTLGGMEMFCILIGVGVMWGYIFVKTQIVHLKICALHYMYILPLQKQAK